MEKHIDKTKLYAGGITILLFAALTTAGVLFDVKGDLQTDLNNAKLNNEQLLSEKLMLDKQINQLKGEMLSLTSHSQELTNRLETAATKIKEQENTINQVRKQNNGLKKEVDGMRKLKEQLELELNNLKAANKALTDANRQMETGIAELVAENNALKEKLKGAALLKASNFRIDVMRKRVDRLTAKASRTHQLSVSFDLPESAMANMGKSKVYMIIKGPDGQVLAESGEAKKTIFADGIKVEFTPSVTKDIDFGKGQQRVTLNYSPEDAIEAGIYKVELYTDYAFLGNSQFRLMR